MIGVALLQGRRKTTLFGAAGAAVFLAAVALGWSDHGSLAARAAPAATDPWALPKTHQADAEADAAILRTRRPWGGAASFRDSETPAAAQSATANAPWRFVGTVMRGNENFALIEVAGQLKYIAAGAALPDNGTVTQIEQDSIVVQRPAGSSAGPTTYRLFHKNS
jgi:hypothetical protein